MMMQIKCTNENYVGCMQVVILFIHSFIHSDINSFTYT